MPPRPRPPLSSAIPSWVAGYVGMRFAAHGRTREDGVDCWGLTRLVYAERMGIMLPSLDVGYVGVDDRTGIAKLFVQQREEPGRWRHVEAGEVGLELGDLAVFRIGRDTGHVGIVVGRRDFLHAIEGIDSCVERLDGPLWAPRLVEFLRYAGPVRVHGRPRVFRPDHVDVELPAGGTLAEMLEASGVDPSPLLRVWIGDREVRRDLWRHVRPKPGRTVRVTAVPAGGGEGGKTGLRIFLTIAVIAAAIAAPYVLAGSVAAGSTSGFAAGTLGGAFLSAGVGLAGTLLVTALIPPAKPRLSAGDTLASPAIAGSRNEVRQFAPLPMVLGRYQYAPPFGAAPYTEVVGDDQYLRLLFVMYGPVEISEPKIGTTSVYDYEGVQLEIRPGYPDDDPITLYPGTVLEDGYALPLHEQESWTVRTSRTLADELSVDITFPGGLAHVQPDGSHEDATVRVEVQYAPAGSGAWQTVNGDGGTGGVGSPTDSAGMEPLFRTPESDLGGQVDHITRVAWGAGFPDAKPAYLPPTAFSWVAEGWIFTEVPGTYTFGLDSSDAADLAIDGRTRVTWYGGHAPAGGGGTPDFNGHQATVNLDYGWHAVRVRVESRGGGVGGGGNLAMGWKVPGVGVWEPIPLSALYFAAGSESNHGLRARWYTWGSYTSTVTTTASRTDQVRRSLTWAVPTGQYDVRIRRVTPDTTDPLILDQVVWTALRTIRHQDPVKLAGVAKIALRIKATNQLNGVIDNFNAIFRSILQDWDPATQTWVRRATSNPASCYRGLFQGGWNKRPLPDARLKLVRLQEWHEANTAKGLEFNAIYDTQGTLWERLHDVAAAGRATPGHEDGLFSVVRDVRQTVPRQHLTPRNSFGFKGRKAFPDLPHALRVQFVNRDNAYQRGERIVLADGYQIDGLDAFGHPAPGLPLATVYEVLELIGVTSAAEAWMHGRYNQAVPVLRPELFELGTDLEHLACSRGDLVLVTHDVPQFGLGFGRVAALQLDMSGNLVGLSLDDTVTMESGGGVITYVIRVRLSDGTTWLRTVVTVPGTSQSVTLSAPVDAGAPMPAPGDLWMFGRQGLESRELLVKSIEIDRDLAARLTLVDAAPAVLDADTGTIPPYDPGISLPPPWDRGPEAPVIESIRSDDYVMLRGADGSLEPRMLITLRSPSSRRPIPVHAQVRIRPVPAGGGEPTGPWNTLPLIPIDNSQVSVTDVEEGVTYQIRLRTLSAAGAFSVWVAATHTMVGKTLPPPDVQTFDVTRQSDGTREYRWTLGVTPPDIAGVRIRYAVGGSGAAWDAMTDLTTEVLQASPAELNDPPSGSWRFAIRAVDTSGNLSLHPLYIERTLGEPRLEGVAFSSDQAPDLWPGTRTDCHLTAERTLEADDRATWDTLVLFGVLDWNRYPRWVISPKSPIVYESLPLDAGFEFTWSPDAIAVCEGSALVEVSWSSDGVVYTPYADVTQVRGTSVVAQFLKARVTVSETGTVPIPVIRSLLVLMRAQAVVTELEDVVTSALDPRWRLGVGDIRLPIPAGRYQRIRNVAITFNGMGAGWSWELVDRDATIGPRVRLYNADQVLSHATIDAVIRGL